MKIDKDEPVDPLWRAFASVYNEPAPGVSWRDYVDQRYTEQERALEAALVAQQAALDAALATSLRALDDQSTAAAARQDESSRLSLERLDWLRREQEATHGSFDAIIQRVTSLGTERLEGVRREVDALASTVGRDRVTFEKALIDNAAHSDERTQAVRAEAEAVRIGSDRAISKSEVAAELRFQSVNEFRAQLQDQQNATAKRDALLVSTLMPREVAEAQLRELGKQIASMQQRLDLSAGRGNGISASLGLAMTVMGFAIVIVIAVANYLTSTH